MSAGGAPPEARPRRAHPTAAERDCRAAPPQNMLLARSRSISKSTSTAGNAEMSSGRKRMPSSAMAVSMARSK